MDIYKSLIRPLLFRLDTERGHELAKAVLRQGWLGRLLMWHNLAVNDTRLQVDVGRLRVPNPIGLAAGFDKDCDMLASLDRMGFGYIVAGSVLYRVRPGNPRPRMIRDHKDGALFSCMGLPSKGLDYAAMHLKGRNPGRTPLVINVNAETFNEYVRCMEVLEPLGDAMEISLFLANRDPAEGDFLQPSHARMLMEEVIKRTTKPLFIKLPGYDSADERQKRLDLIELLISYNVDGITITPKTSVKDDRLSIKQGAITGKPAFPKTVAIIRDLFETTRGRCHIKAAGGIFSAEDAFEAIAAGATTVELVTGLGYEGWRVARNINRGLLRLLEKKGIENVSVLRGIKTAIHRQTHS